MEYLANDRTVKLVGGHLHRNGDYFLVLIKKFNALFNY